MTEQAETVSTEGGTPDTTSGEQSFDQRLASVYESLSSSEGEGEPSDVAEPEGTSTGDEPGESFPDKKTDEPETKSAAQKEREERIAAVRERERKLREEHEARKAPREDASKTYEQLEQLQAQVREAARLAEALEDEEAFLAEAERRGISGDKIAKYVHERLLAPEVAAERKAIAAAREADARVEAQVAELRAELEAMRAAEHQKALLQEQQAAERELLHLAGSAADNAPFSARYIQHFGPEQYIAYATAVAEALPPGVGLQAVHDVVESNLEALARIAGTQQARQAPETDHNPDAPVRARTVSNSLASERASVRDDGPMDLADLPFEERVRRLLAG